MLSILIPTYNYDIREFAAELNRQAVACGVEFEIRCYDDGSSPKYCEMNRELQQIGPLVYRELPENIGRSAIRNLLADEARYEYLLFLDCDSFPEGDDFIKLYLDALQEGALLYGGRSYAPQPPEDTALFFRWFYGSHREVIPLAERQLHPYQSFQTNNFLIPKKLYLDIRLDESLKGYGHEDTLFGLELKQRQTPVIHIENPLRHLGLETSDEFIDKTMQGIENLALLLKKGISPNMIRLAATYRRLRSFGLRSLYLLWFKNAEQRLLKKIKSENPSLKAFDLYKLGLLCRAMRH